MHIVKAIGGFQSTLANLLDRNDQDNISIRKALAIQQMEDTKLITPKTLPRVEQYVKGERPLRECCIMQKPFDMKFYSSGVAK